MRQTANAFPTCEGALQLAMEQTAFTLQNARCLVIGAGRIGMLLARKLYALDAQVTVSARCTRDFARIAAAGLHALDTRRLAGHLAGFDLIFNTVPAPILTTEVLSDMKPPCFIIDLASLPGGVAADTLLPDGCRVLHALSLPGKVAPLSAARAVFDTVDTILHGDTVTPILSDSAGTLDTRFGTAAHWREELTALTGISPIDSIVSAEPIGPKALFDILIVAPCTGNTLARLAHGLTDTPATMAVKSHLRGERPVVLAVSTNDGLSGSAANLGTLLNRRHYYFVPLRQDAPHSKPRSLVADMTLIPAAIDAAMNGRQLQPILLAPSV